MSPNRPAPTLAQKILLLTGSVILCVVILFIAEAFCRLFLDINLRRTSAAFLIADDQGNFIANAKNAEGVSYGANVYSDQYGFRIDPNFENRQTDKAILFLGDSVTFGVGVPEEATFAGRMRKGFRDVTVYNSAVPGTDLEDYRDVVKSFVPQHPEIFRVYLVYCLNDFIPANVPKEIPAENQTLYQSIKAQGRAMLGSINAFFIPRSELYIWLTGKVSDPAKLYFEADRDRMNVDDSEFDRVMSPIVEISRNLGTRGIDFVVVINPYEAQLREPTDVNLAPQARIESYLMRHDIRFVDTMDRFKQIVPTSASYLFADPMHLSETGHSLVYEALVDDWQQRGNYNNLFTEK